MVHLGKAKFGRDKLCFLRTFGLFASKRDANSCKTQCYLLQNAVLTHAKRKVKCSKTQGKMQQNAEQSAAFCRLKRSLLSKI